MSKQADFYMRTANPEARKLFSSLLPQPETESSPWEITECELLFNEFKGLSYRVRDCGAIVQNEGQTITKEELTEWAKISTSVITDLAALLMKTKTFLESQQC